MELGDIKNFGKNWELTGTFGMFFGRLSAIFGHKPTFEISKITDFRVIQGKFGDFFFQNDDLVQNCPEMTKNDFFELL